MPKRNNEQEVMSRAEPFSWRGDYDASGNLIYEAWAVPGSSTSSAVWLVAKNSYDGSNNLTTIQWAGTADFNQIWDNHLSLSYS